MKEQEKTRLTPELEQFVEDMGLRYEEEGFPPMVGRLIGWLLVCEPPHQTAGELAEVLGASAGSISTVSRTLLQCGLAEKIAVPGQRSASYRIRTGAWTEMMRSHLDKTRRTRELAERGLEILKDRDAESLRRLTELRDFEKFIEEQIPGLLRKWEERKS